MEKVGLSESSTLGNIFFSFINYPSYVRREIPEIQEDLILTMPVIGNLRKLCVTYRKREWILFVK